MEMVLQKEAVKVLREALKAKHFSEVKFTEGVDMSWRAEDIAKNDLKVKERYMCWRKLKNARKNSACERGGIKTRAQ